MDSFISEHHPTSQFDNHALFNYVFLSNELSFEDYKHIHYRYHGMYFSRDYFTSTLEMK